MNRRELALGVAAAAVAGAASAQTAPTPLAQANVAPNSPYYPAYNDQIGRLPQAVQADVPNYATNGAVVMTFAAEQLVRV